VEGKRLGFLGGENVVLRDGKSDEITSYMGNGVGTRACGQLE